MSGSFQLLLSSVKKAGGVVIGYMATINTPAPKFSVLSGSELYVLTEIEPTGFAAVLIRLSLAGAINSQFSVGEGFASFAPIAVAVDSSGNIIIAGNKRASSVNSASVVKLNSSGVIQWQRRIPQTANGPVFVQSVAVDSSNNIYITGTSNLGSSTVTDAYVAKFDGATGNALFKRTIGVTGTGADDSGQSIAARGSAVHMTGFVTTVNVDVALFNINTSTGVPDATRFFRDSGNTGRQEGTAVLIDSAGQVYQLALWYNDLSVGSQQRGLIMKIDPTAGTATTITWQGSYAAASGSTNMTPRAMCFDPTEAHVYVVFTFVNDAMVIKVDASTGNLVWQRRLSGGVRGAVAISCDSSDNIYVHGQALMSSNFLNYIFKIPGDGSRGTGTLVINSTTVNYTVASEAYSTNPGFTANTQTTPSADNTPAVETPASTVGTTSFVRTIANLVT